MVLEDNKLEGTTFRVYLYAVKEGRPVGPRDVMRGADLSSPSVAYRHLQKLETLGLVQKNAFGEYIIKEKANVKGYLWLGRNLVPRLLFYSFFFVGIFVAEIVVVVTHFFADEPLQIDFVFLIFVTSVALVMFLFEGSKLSLKGHVK